MSSARGRSAGVWLIDRASIEQRRAHPPPAGRPLSALNAWRVLLPASGEDVGKDADPVARWRVRDALDRRGLDGLNGGCDGMPRRTISGGSPVSCEVCENATMSCWQERPPPPAITWISSAATVSTSTCPHHERLTSSAFTRCSRPAGAE